MGAMDLLFTGFVLFLAADQTCSGVSSKMDFGSDSEVSSDPEDVEVHQTIVVSTKVNNKPRGIHGSLDNNGGVSHYNFAKKDDDGEVPVVRGFKAVDTTRIRTPDTRNKPKNTESVFISRNLQDGYNLYPQLGASQWKPSTLFNNINWWESDANNVYIPRPDNTVKFQRKITDEGMKEFYCKRCRELAQGQRIDCFGGHSTSRSAWNYETYHSTTPKVKIDGKIAKLN